MKGRTTDATTEFFAKLATRGHEPLLGTTTANVRFDIVKGTRTDHWLLAIRQGVIDVSHADGEADCILRADAAAFDEVAGGTTNAMAAALRGAITIEGDARLLVRVQRLFPSPVGPPKVSGERAVGRRRS